MPRHETRGAGSGRYERDIDTAERDAEAAHLRARGRTYQAIADELGYADRSNARHAVQRALAAVQAEAAEEVRKLELERLDEMQRAVLEVLERKHVTVQQGKVVYLDEKPLQDDAPVLSAVDRLLKIQERRAKLLGLDTPVRADVTVHRVDPTELALHELLAEARAKQAAEEAALKGEDRG